MVRPWTLSFLRIYLLIASIECLRYLQLSSAALRLA